jgi:hypothetical protein
VTKRPLDGPLLARAEWTLLLPNLANSLLSYLREYPSGVAIATPSQ